MTVQHDDQRRQRARGRGWLLSLAAILSWQAVLMLVLLAIGGLPDPDTLYYWLGPKLVVTVVAATPLTYLVSWRRPRPFRQVALFALPVFLLCLALLLQQP